MTKAKRPSKSLCFTAVALSAAWVSGARATEYFDGQRGEIAARVATQNTFQHDNTKSIQWVQWRNELRFDLKYQGIKPGNDVGPFNLFNLNLLWRGRYDPVYTLRQSYRDRNYDRADFEFPEGRVPREAFVDIGFNGALSPLSFRIGRQQVVWGEADLFRSIDVVNPLDIRQSGFVGEDFADLRQPLLIAKGLWNIGSVGKYLNEAGLEFFFSPNSRPQASQQNVLFGETFKLTTNQHNVLTGFDRNLVLPFRQVRAPWEFGRVGARFGDSPAVVQNADGSLTDFMYQIKNDVPSDEFSTDALMAGVRLLGTTVGNAYFTVNYLFKRSDPTSAAVEFQQLFDQTKPGTGSLQPAVLGRAVAAAQSPDANGNGIPDAQETQILNCLQSRQPELILDPHLFNPKFPGFFDGSVYSDPRNPQLHTGARKPGKNSLRQDNISYKPVLPVPGDGLVHSSACLDIPVFHPWTHIIGFTMTYNDYDYTGLVFRMEESFSTKEPRQQSPSSPERLLDQVNHPGNPAFVAVPQKRDFDTRAKRYTQVWRSMVGFDYLRAIAPQYGHHVSNEVLRSLLTDQWFFTFQFLNEYDAHADHVDNSASFTNRYQHFNPFFTVSGTGFFVHQTFRPTWAIALDTNQMFPLFYLQGQYYLSPRFELRVGEILYAGSKNQEDFNGLHYYADRDTFFVRLTYFFV